MTKHERAIEAALSAHERCKSRNGGKHGMWMEAAIAAYQRTMREPAEGEVRVRVAVLVAQEGCWSAAGGHDMSDEWAIERAEERLMDANQTRWIEATVPGWLEETVEGEVVG